MKYLFFDIECSDGRNIMSFGYVLTDDRFNILEKNDILMNPRAIFHTGAWSKKKRELYPGVEIPYPKSEFLKRPPFPGHYRTIRKIITARDRIVLGFSHNNDTLFLDTACKRYRLPSIDYDFYDVQVIHKEMFNAKNYVSTEAVVKDLGINVDDYVAHRSDDDAEVSMLMAKKICENENVSLEELLARYPDSAGSHRNFKTVYLYKTRAESLISFINGNTQTGDNRMKSSNFSKFNAFLEDMRPDASAPKVFEGTSFCFRRTYFETHFREMLLIVQAIMDRGGRYSQFLQEADCFVYEKHLSREERKRVAALEKKGKTVKCMRLDELLDAAGLTKEKMESFLVREKPASPEGFDK